MKNLTPFHSVRMKALCSVFLVGALRCVIASEQPDHLEPIDGTLFEYDFAYAEMIRIREALLTDKETRTLTNVIRVVEISGSSMPSVSVVMLVQHGDVHIPDEAQYTLVYRQVLNPRISIHADKSSEAKLRENKISIDMKLAKRMIAVWTAILKRTRYASVYKSPPLDSAGGDYHCVFTLGEGNRAGRSPRCDKGPIVTLNVEVRHLRAWIESDGKSQEEKQKFIEHLAELERYYLKNKR